MTDIEKAIKNVLEFEKYLDFIEKNISKKSPDIIEELRKEFFLSRTVLQGRFKKICISKDGDPLSPATYIKRRQNQMNLLNRSTEKGKEIKFDTNEIVDRLRKLHVAQKYGFIDVDIDNENYSLIKINYNYEKIINFIFSDNTLVYIGDLDSATPKEILEYNKSLINECDFDYFYKSIRFEINKVHYLKVDIQWLIEIVQQDNELLDIFFNHMIRSLYEDLNKYKTIFNKSKSTLGIIEYKRSIKEFINDEFILLEKEKTILSTVSDIEINKIENLKFFDFISDCLEKGIFKTYREGIFTFIGLLCTGLIYIDN